MIRIALAVCWIVVLGYALGAFLLAAHPIQPTPAPQPYYP